MRIHSDMGDARKNLLSIDKIMPAKALGIIIFLFLSMSGLVAQKIQFKGKVIDFDSKAPLGGITVSIPSIKKSTITDAKGMFGFLLEVDSYTLFFSSVEYKSFSQPIYIVDQEYITVPLKRKLPTELPEVTVQPRRKDANVSEAKMSTVNINLARLSKAPLVFGEADILKALTLQTGISTIGEGAGGFSVRGGNADQNLVLIDGAPVYNTSHLLGFYSTVSPEAVQDFTMYKGAIPASFGGRLSSLIALNIKSGNPDTMHFGGGVSPVSLHVFAGGPLLKKSKFTFSVDGRIAYPKLVMNAFPGSVQNSNAFFYDGVAKLTYRPDQKNQVSLALYRSYDLFKFPGDTSYSWQSTIITLNGRSELGKNISLYYNGNVSNNISDINGLQPSYQFRLRTSIESQEAKFALHYQPAHGIYFEGGGSFTRYDVGPGALRPIGSSSQINGDKIDHEFGNEIAGYLLSRVDITSLISVEAGIRYTSYAFRGPHTVYNYAAGTPQSKESIVDSSIYPGGQTIITYHGWEPRLLLKFGIDDETSIKLSYIKTRQNLQLISNTIAITPVDYWKLSDPLRRPATADHYAAGLFHNFSDNTFESSVEGFLKMSNDILDYKNGASLSMNRYIDAELLSAKGKSYGIEFNFRKTKGIVTGQLAYTWSRSFVTDMAQFASEAVNKGNAYPSNYDRPVNLDLSGSIKLGQGWEFGCTFVYLTGRPVSFPDGTYAINNTIVANYSVRNLDRLPDYNRLDISFSHDSRRYAGQKKYSIINFSLYNVYARKNPYSIYFQRDATVLNAYELSVLGTVIPSVTLNYFF